MQNFPLPFRFGRLASGLLGVLIVLAIAAAAWLALSLRPADAATAEPAPLATSLESTSDVLAELSSDSPTPATSPTPAPSPSDTRPRKPATRTHKAKRVPAFPDDAKHAGMKRIVYDKALMTVWLIDKHEQVVARYPVVGRWDRPKAGLYHVFSKSPKAVNPNSKVTFNHMVRFTYGPDTKSPIGLHAIPRYYDGTRMHSVKQLGLPIARGGCVRLSEKAAAAVYKFARVGTAVVVLPSP